MPSSTSSASVKTARPSVDLRRPDLRINARISGTQATISLDLSGESLHRRGYRKEGSEAPLKENLAAAILLRAGWSEIAASGGSLFDPLCGSGTLVIEAALIAGDSAPGLTRTHFGFLKWKQHQPHIWQRQPEAARVRRRKGMQSIPVLMGCDRDEHGRCRAHGLMPCAHKLIPTFSLNNAPCEILRPVGPVRSISD